MPILSESGWHLASPEDANRLADQANRVTRDCVESPYAY
jgi:lipopolysaccharide biosynthesis regulator YciM